MFSVHDLKSLQCANEITPANQSSNPLCGFQASLHVFAGHSVALLGNPLTLSSSSPLILVVCRTIYLHCQICWDLYVNKLPLIILNIIGWLIPAIFLGLVFVVAEMTYTIGDHCSIRIDWLVNILIIPIIIEIGCSIVVQFATFVYCANVFLRSLNEPAPPTVDSLNGGQAGSQYSGGSRYPYRKAMKRINKVRTATLGILVDVCRFL